MPAVTGSRARTAHRARRRFAQGAAALVAALALTGSAQATAAAAAPDRAAGPGAAVPGVLADGLAGGDPIEIGGSRCALGFNLTDGTAARYGLTAGQCAQAGDRAFPVGTVVASVFPGGDYALVRYDDPAQAEGGVRGADGGVIDITGARGPSVGEQGCVSGPSSGVHCGSVQALNVSVNYGDGIVSGLAQVGVCTEPGDLGAPFYDGSTALGIVVFTGGCGSGGATLVMPITQPLNAFGMTVL